MSTNIADLPGPVSEEIEDNVSQKSFEDVQERIEPQVQRRHIPKEKLYEQPSRIKMDIKKVNKAKYKAKDKTEERGLFDIIKNEVNEKNLLILMVLYIASTPLIDNYVKKILNLISFNTSSSLVVNILKCVILLLVFILAKHFLLPYIRV
jgi:hypothetical protein